MYSQCDRLIFSETRLPKLISVQYTLGEKNETLDVTKSSPTIKEITNKTDKDTDEDTDEEDQEDESISGIDELFADEIPVKLKTTTTKTNTATTSDDDADLLQELADIF